MKKILTIAIALLALNVAAQSLPGTSVRVFDEAVRTLQVYPASNPYLPPVINLNGDDRIIVSFDLLDYDLHYLRYSLVHCDANWTPSQLFESEFVDGFNYADITDYAQSVATFTHYYNYTFALPNDDMRITKSGNYLLKVYEQDDPDHVLFQTRFMVADVKVGVQATVTSRTDVDYNNEHQQLAIDLNYKPGTIDDPYSNLLTVVSQNTRTDEDHLLRRPTSVAVGQVTYEHMPQLIFNAGNEYHRFEHVNTGTINMGIQRIDYFEPFYHATLYTDEPRRELQHLYDQTRHGRFTIRNSMADDSRVEADYVITHFTLDAGGPLSGGNIFLEGEFTHGYDPRSALMTYDMSTGMYHAEVMLKQGQYNYQYLWVPEGQSIGVTSMVDGDKFQTSNQYFIRVYYRPSGGRYDQLVGYGIVYSGL